MAFIYWPMCRLLQARVPTKFLPPTVSVPHRAGTLLMDWLGIREGTPVGVAMGDMQCSVYAAQPSHTDAGKLIPQ